MFVRGLLTTGLLCATLVGVMPGCGTLTEDVHEQQVGDANARWNGVKSGIALNMATDSFNSGNLKLAQNTINDALMNDGENPELWLMSGRIALENSELELSYRCLEKAIEFDPELPGSYYYQGVVSQRWQRYEQALEKYTKAYELDADNAAYYLAKAEMMVQLGQLDAVAFELEEKARYFDQNAAMRAMLGHVKRRQGDHPGSMMWFKQATMLAPDDMKLREELARAQMNSSRFGDASTTLRELILTDYGNERSDLFRMLAESYIKLEKIRDARGVYTELTRNDASNVEDWFQLGSLAYRMQDYPAALNASNRVINLAPDDHRGYLLAGMTWSKRDRVDRALSLFDRAADLAPLDTTPLILRGIALQKTDRPAAAAEAYRRALQVNPQDVRAQRLLSSVTEELH